MTKQELKDKMQVLKCDVMQLIYDEEAWQSKGAWDKHKQERMMRRRMIMKEIKALENAARKLEREVK